MEVWTGIAITIFLAVVTPGPNNFVILALAAERGFPAALPAMVGVVGGTLCLLMLVLAGLAPALAQWPALDRAVTVAAAILLFWLAVGCVRRTGGGPVARMLPHAGLWSMFVFQLANPKSWALVLAISAAAVPAGGLAIPILALLFLLLPAISLTLWALSGRLLQRCFDGRMSRLPGWAMAVLLSGLAVQMLWKSL